MRAQRDYEAFSGDYSKKEGLFTYSDLMAELAFEDTAVSVKLPGHVISSTVSIAPCLFLLCDCSGHRSPFHERIK